MTNISRLSGVMNSFWKQVEKDSLTVRRTINKYRFCSTSTLIGIYSGLKGKDEKYAEIRREAIYKIMIQRRVWVKPLSENNTLDWTTPAILDPPVIEPEWDDKS